VPSGRGIADKINFHSRERHSNATDQRQARFWHLGALPVLDKQTTTRYYLYLVVEDGQRASFSSNMASFSSQAASQTGSSQSRSAITPSSSQTETQTEAPAHAPTQAILRLRGAHNPSGRSVQWRSDVVDNEGLGRKSSKGMSELRQLHWRFILTLRFFFF
jgi:protein phosphatase 1 regulatory subunit 11